MRVNVVAAGRLDADGHVAEGEHRKMKGAIAEEGIGLRNVPARGDLFTDGIGQLDEIFLVFARLNFTSWGVSGGDCGARADARRWIKSLPLAGISPTS